MELIDAELVLEADVERSEWLDDQVVEDVWCELCVFHARKVRGVAWGSRKKFGERHGFMHRCGHCARFGGEEFYHRAHPPKADLRHARREEKSEKEGREWSGRRGVE
ncbi:MAG: hypothetical protein R3B67_06000 [Phycisphaerales bacterium]